MPDTRRLVLASQSPRRRALLEALGVPFRVVAPALHVEPSWRDESPADYARHAAREKARDVFARIDADEWGLSADTIVAVDSEVLGKPGDKRELAAMLGRLSGRWHDVWTAVVLGEGRTGQQVSEACVCTQVRMVELSREEIAQYAQTGEGLDKAGGYAVQGHASAFVQEVRGSYTNVVGLPLAQVRSMLKALGLI